MKITYRIFRGKAIIEGRGKIYFCDQMLIERLGIRFKIRYLVKRSEKAAYAAPTPEQGKYLNPERLVPVNER